MSSRAAAAWVAVFALLTLAATVLIDTGPDRRGRDQAKDSSAAQKARSVKVLRVVDGDTIVARDLTTGRSQRVRYIGVDTPESVKPDTPVECYGHEASDFNRRLVEGRIVRLVFDREPFDRFGRSLAYVHIGDTFVNAELLERGFARTLEIEPNTSKAAYFDRLQRVAMRTNTGLWKACRR